MMTLSQTVRALPYAGVKCSHRLSRVFTEKHDTRQAILCLIYIVYISHGYSTYAKRIREKGPSVKIGSEMLSASFGDVGNILGPRIGHAQLTLGFASRVVLGDVLQTYNKPRSRCACVVRRCVLKKMPTYSKSPSECLCTLRGGSSSIFVFLTRDVARVKHAERVRLCVCNFTLPLPPVVSACDSSLFTVVDCASDPIPLHSSHQNICRAKCVIPRMPKDFWVPLLVYMTLNLQT